MFFGWGMPFLPLLGGVLGGGAGCCGGYAAGIAMGYWLGCASGLETYSAAGLRVLLIDRARWIPRAAR